MTRPAKLVEPRGEPQPPPPTLEAAAVALPPAVPAFSRADATSLVVAGALHLAALAAFLAPDNRLGSGGVDLDALGVDIVTVAPALEARTSARGRGEAAARAQVAEQDGGAEPLPEETAAPASPSSDKPAPGETAPPPADLAVKDWNEPVKPADAPAIEPVIARTKADGAEPNAPDRARPAEDDLPAAPPSPSASEVLARFQGGAAARGLAPFDTSSSVMAAARAGQRDAYKEAIVNAIRANPPRGVQGQSGKVKLEFAVRPDGTLAEIRVAVSSNSRLDASAIAALSALRVPPPPATLTRDKLVYDMEFTFQ